MGLSGGDLEGGHQPPPRYPVTKLPSYYQDLRIPVTTKFGGALPGPSRHRALSCVGRSNPLPYDRECGVMVGGTSGWMDTRCRDCPVPSDRVCYYQLPLTVCCRELNSVAGGTKQWAPGDAQGLAFPWTSFITPVVNSRATSSL